MVWRLYCHRNIVHFPLLLDMVHIKLYLSATALSKRASYRGQEGIYEYHLRTIC